MAIFEVMLEEKAKRAVFKEKVRKAIRSSSTVHLFVLNCFSEGNFQHLNPKDEACNFLGDRMELFFNKFLNSSPTCHWLNKQIAPP